MDTHATPLLGMIEVYFYIELNFPSKPKKVCIKFGLPVLQRKGKFKTPSTIQEGWLNVSWASTVLLKLVKKNKA